MKRFAVGLALLAFLSIILGLAVFRRTLFPPPIAAVLHYEFEAPPGQEESVRQDLLEVINGRIDQRGRARAGEGKRIEIDVYGEDPKAAGVIADWLDRPGTLELRMLAQLPDQSQSDIDRAQESYPETGSDTLEWIPVANPRDFDESGPEISDPSRTALLTVIPPEGMRVSGRHISRASVDHDASGMPALLFRLNREGADRLRTLTRANLPGLNGRPKQMAVIVDGKVLNAPRLLDEIGPKAFISGRFTREEVEAMAAAFTSGPLPTTIHRIGP